LSQYARTARVRMTNCVPSLSLEAVSGKRFPQIPLSVQEQTSAPYCSRWTHSNDPAHYRVSRRAAAPCRRAQRYKPLRFFPLDRFARCPAPRGATPAKGMGLDALSAKANQQQLRRSNAFARSAPSRKPSLLRTPALATQGMAVEACDIAHRNFIAGISVARRCRFTLRPS